MAIGKDRTVSGNAQHKHTERSGQDAPPTNGYTPPQPTRSDATPTRSKGSKP